MKLRANVGGNGRIGNYTLSIGANEAKQLNFLNEDGTSKNLKKIIKENLLIIEEDKMEGIKLEKATVKYNKEGEYEYTINSEYLDFPTDAKAMEYVQQNVEKDVEYFFYWDDEEVEKSNHYKNIICNDLKKKLSVKNYQINSTVFIEDEFGEQEDSFNIYFDELEFDSNEDLEEYIKEEIETHIELSKIDADSLSDAIDDIWVRHNHRINQ